MSRHPNHSEKSSVWGWPGSLLKTLYLQELCSGRGEVARLSKMTEQHILLSPPEDKLAWISGQTVTFRRGEMNKAHVSIFYFIKKAPFFLFYHFIVVLQHTITCCRVSYLPLILYHLPLHTHTHITVSISANEYTLILTCVLLVDYCSLAKVTDQLTQGS